MEDILKDKSKEDFCISFSEKEEGFYIDILKSKFEQIGISPKEKDQRPVFFYQKEDQRKLNSVCDKVLKKWINDQGTSVFVKDENSKTYKNWERLITSEMSENVVLGILMINSDFRPTPKFFSLLLYLGLFRDGDELIKNTAESILLSYVELKTWELLKKDAGKLHQFYIHERYHLYRLYSDLNYLQFWSVFFDNKLLGKGRGLYLSSDNIEFIFNSPVFRNLIRNVKEITLRIEKESLSYSTLEFLVKLPEVTSMSIYSDTEYFLNKDELRLLNIMDLNLNNIYLNLESVSYTHLTLPTICSV